MAEKDKESDKESVATFWISADIVDIDGDICAICRNHLKQPCFKCDENQPNHLKELLKCHEASGTCNHVFHLHCISRWLKTKWICPIDNRTWEYKSSSA